MMICMCGVQSGGYPHHEDCPFPYYGQDELMMARWEMHQENRIAGREMHREAIEHEKKNPLPPGFGPQGHGVND